MKALWGVLFFAAVAANLTAQDAPKASKQTFEKVCGACHPTDNATTSRRTKDQWQTVIQEMINEQGAKVGDDEFSVVLDYLSKNYGKVNVNSATAGEIAQIAGLTPEEAEAIVKYRKEKGKIEDFDGLTKVPGVDAKKLEKNREALSY